MSMFSQEVAIAIFVVAVLIICGSYFIFSRKSEKLKGYRKNVFILVAVVFGGLYFSFVNHVYILNEEQNTYEEKILFLPAKFTLANKQQLSITPKFGIYSVIINNSQRNAVFETVIYGNSSGRPDIKLPAQAVTYVNKGTDYIFKEPPNSVKIKGSGTTKGWIHY